MALLSSTLTEPECSFLATTIRTLDSYVILLQETEVHLLNPDNTKTLISSLQRFSAQRLMPGLEHGSLMLLEGFRLAPPPMLSDSKALRINSAASVSNPKPPWAEQKNEELNVTLLHAPLAWVFQSNCP